MEKISMKRLWIGLDFISVFMLWTGLVSLIDVKLIEPNGSSEGFATINGFVHDTVGVHMTLYTITDWLGLFPLGVVFGFAVLGLVQLIRRRRLFKVDRIILLLGGLYSIVMAAYLLFEEVVINYRPMLIDGNLEASYPSSTTMLALCVCFLPP